MTDRVGQQLGSYRLLQLLGQGGFAEVYLGEHIHLNTQAAIKVLRTQLSTDDVSNFRIEARTIAHLIHPNIVQVLDFGVEGDTPFLVMAYAPNGTLRQRHPRGIPLPVESVLLYVKQIAAALQYAHDKKVIHRDIKPENMLLGRNNEVLLSDFGIALITPSARAGTIFGQSSIPNQTTWDPAGTVTYMAPEQIQGKPSPASDQYSLGIVVYEWLSGHAPFSGGYMEIAMQHMSASPTPLREKLTAISPDVEQVIMTALAKDPQRRFGSVQAFANALEQASRGPQRVISSTLSPSSPENAPVSSQAAEESSMEVILFGPSGGTILGSSVVTIGRNASNTVVVNDPQASAFHAEIRPSGQGHRIIDLNSTNGTFVNEQRLAPGSSRQLNWGDTLRVGETKLNYGGGSATQNRVSTSDPATVRADSGYSGYVPSGPAPAPPPPISNTGYGGIVQQAYPQQPAPFPSVYPPPAQQPAYGVLAPQQPAYPQSGPGISGSSPNNVTPVQFNVSSTLPDNVAQQPAYNAQVGLPATPISSPGTTGAISSQAASSSSKRRRPVLLIALLGILVFVLVGGGVLAFVLYQNSLPTPAKTLDAFCNALQGSDYTSAYNQLSDNLKGKVPEPIFANFFAKVSSCSYAAPNVTGMSATTTLTTVTTHTNTDQLILAEQGNGTWKIDSDANLVAFVSLSDLTKTLDTFCRAFQSGDYATDYGQFSANLQQKITQSLFSDFFPNPTSCSYSTPTITGTSATTNLSLAYGGQTENDALNLIEDSNNNWQIDTFANLSTPLKTLNAFCNGLKSEMYQQAYDQLSSDYQQQTFGNSEATFQNAYSYNNNHGRVTLCTISNVQDNGSSAVGKMSYVLLDGTTGSAVYTLIYPNGIWKINGQYQ